MAKKKQSKLYQLNKQKSKQHKDEMKSIMKKLAQNKQKNKQTTNKLTAITQMNMKNKKIQKQFKQLKYQQKQQKSKKNYNKFVNFNQQLQQQKQIITQNKQTKPKVNIFSLSEYDTGNRVQLNNPIDIQPKIDESILLQYRAREAMGQNFTLDKFGDKPLKIIQQNQQVHLSDDEDQPNSLKNISHKNIKIPQGNYIINRKDKIAQFRKSLPIIMKEQQLIQTINNNLVTLVCGQTGSGKSTQLPQFLIQKNYHKLGKIAVTQPRRLATISLASRVAQQVNTKLGDLVGYQIRHQRKDSKKTIIKFLTDGILLNQMNTDFLLQQYSVIVIDQAHERKVNTDILIGLLSRVVLLRYQMSLQAKCQPLRLVIMSATMRIDDFKNTTLFDFNVPILKVQARMFPVTTFFEKNTPQDYKNAAVKKCIKIHKSLPDGDVLIFLTGKQQIHEMKILLEQQLQRQHFLQAQMQQQFQQQQQQIQIKQNNIQQQQPLLQKQIHSSKKPFVIFQLYSSLPLQDQNKIFLAQSEGTRKFIIATNIAQTSITIPGIRYVIDCGQQKHRYFDKVWKWKKGWGSKAMAEQRAGRAGRTAHGYCYRLYSAALYANIMDEFPPPQILKQPLDSTILQLKSIGIDNVYQFPFPTKPQCNKISQTLQKLLNLKALTGLSLFKQQKDNTKITKLGQVLSFIPLDPKLGKMFLLGRQKKVQQYILYIVILLTVQNIYQQERVSKFFQRDIDDQQTKQNLKQKYLQELRNKTYSFKNKFTKFMDNQQNGDIFTAINVLGEFFVRIYEKVNKNIDKNQFNKKTQRYINEQSKIMYLNTNTMRQVYYNTDQICQIYQTLCNQKIAISSYQKPTSSQIDIILSILLQTFIQNTCRHRQKNKYQNRQQKIIHIHNCSPLYTKRSLFIGCVDYFQTDFNRTYMKYPFMIRDYQLLASFGTVKEEKQYLWRDQRIVGKTTGVIYGWEIPNLYVYSPKDKSDKWIALTHMLLSGQIFNEFTALKKYLKLNLTQIKPENFDVRLQKIVQKFKYLEIDTKQKFIKWYKQDNKFLTKQLQSFYNMKNWEQAYQKIRQTILKSAQ